jgi:hypothetical protein
MSYQLVNKNNSDITLIILSILIGILVIFFINPCINNKNQKEKFEIDSKVTKIIDKMLPSNKINDDLHKIDQKICSKQCCKFIQWPVPFNTKNPTIKDEVLDNFIPSNFACNGGDNGGCVCITKDDYNYLSNHGQN